MEGGGGGTVKLIQLQCHEQGFESGAISPFLESCPSTSLYYPPSTSGDSHLLQMRPCCTICLPLFCMNLPYWVKIPSQQESSANISHCSLVDGVKNLAWEYKFAAAQCAFLFKSEYLVVASLPHRGCSCVLQLKVVVMGTRPACRGGLMCVFEHKSWAKATSDRE